MLWYKAWLETRWRFVIGLVVLICSAAEIVVTYPKVLQLLPLVPSVDVGGEIGRRIREAADLARDFRGYVWSQWFRQNLPQTGTLFAVLLGSGGLLSSGSGGAVLFTLSLPASRTRLLAIRAMTGLAEFFVIVLASSLVIPLLSPGVGQTYGLANVAIHSLCLFVAGASFFSLAFLLSTVFNDVWRPLLVAVGIAIVVALWETVSPGLARVGIFHVMSAETYFRTGHVPWLGLAASAGASAAMLYGASVTIDRRDY